MATDTKKPSDFSDLPRLADDPRWQQANAIKARLQSRLDAFEREADKDTMADAPVRKAASELSSQLLQWATSDDKAEFNPEIPHDIAGTPAERLAGARSAMEMHDRRMMELRGTIQAELAKPWEVERRKLRKKIAEATLALKAAFDEEKEMSDRMRLAEVVDGYLGLARPLANFSAAAQLPGVMGRMNALAFKLCNADLLTS